MAHYSASTARNARLILWMEAHCHSEESGCQHLHIIKITQVSAKGCTTGQCKKSALNFIKVL